MPGLIGVVISLKFMENHHCDLALIERWSYYRVLIERWSYYRVLLEVGLL